MKPLLRPALAALLAAPLLTACVVADGGTGAAPATGTTGAGGADSTSSTGATTGVGGDVFGDGPPGSPTCDPTRAVQANGAALLVTDPAVLAGFSLERVLQQLLDRSPPSGLTPLALLQRLFDAENTAAGGAFADVTHCDTPGNGAFKHVPADGCPRAEGALATRPGLLTPGDKDFFAPVALVNRFDLTSTSLQTCGEYRLVFAKWSGRTDPNDRVFLIFEGALPSPLPGNLYGCHPIAKTWASLETAPDAEARAAILEAFYFDGAPGIKPVVDPNNFGLLASDDDPYQSSHGQVRLSQRMEAPWEMREYHFLVGMGVNPAPHFEPVTVKNNPPAALFGPAGQSPSSTFQDVFVSADVVTLAGPSLASIRMATHNEYNAGESALESAKGPSYLAAVESGADAFLGAIQDRIGFLGDLKCDAADPLTPQAVIARATTQTCAGCHAPSTFLGPDRKLGCGLVWPDSLGGAHIDEKGKLSPALTDVFLPRRAEVMSTYLQACDVVAIKDALQPAPPGEGIPK